MSEANPDITDSPLGQYQKRKSVFPKAVDGTFRRLKWAIMIVTLAIYYITPWIRWDRGPYAPDQAVLIDMPAVRWNLQPSPQSVPRVRLLTGSAAERSTRPADRTN